MTLRLPKREERSERYDSNAEINRIISECFKKSIDNYTDDRAFVLADAKEILRDSEYGEVPYGGKTLKEAGCAVFCFEQGLRSRGYQCKIESLAKEISEKGYYNYGKGTYHNLFDHFGLRRATDAQEINDALNLRKVVTVLVSNCEYTGGKIQKESHFINIVGKDYEGNFFVDDSSLKERQKVDAETIFKSARVVWIW